MLNRVIEVADENRYLSLKRGFLVIEHEKKELGSVPLDDIAVLLLSAQSVTLTKNVLNALSENGCITIFCGRNYLPQSMVLPVSTHTFFTKIVKNQINASLPLKKRIWQQIVIRKIENQSLSLRFCEKQKDSILIQKISTMVKSGDTDNREAYAARMYWQSLFGKTFIRDKNGDGLNALLNYGYAIMRAGMVRTICSHGLLASLGLHHDNILNQFCLADDLFEVYRPLVDCLVFKLWKEGVKELNSETKRALAKCLLIKVHTSEGDSPAIQSMQYMVASYVNALEEKKFFIELPVWEGNESGITIIE